MDPTLCSKCHRLRNSGSHVLWRGHQLRAVSAALVRAVIKCLPISDNPAPTSFPLIPYAFRTAVTSTRLPAPSGMIVKCHPLPGAQTLEFKVTAEIVPAAASQV
jgi:hypothetical protein